MRLGLDHLESTKESGGVKLLNPKTRNDAIDIVWLKGYLNLTDTRPTWAFITDILLNETTPTTLATPTGNLKRAEKIGADTLRMIKAAKKYKATFALINLSRRLREKLPA